MDTQTAKSDHLITLLIELKDYIEREHEVRIRRSHLALNVAGEYGWMTHRRRLQVRRDKSVSFICKWRMSNSANRRPQFSGTSFPAARRLPRGKSGVNNTPGESYIIESTRRYRDQMMKYRVSPLRHLSTTLSFFNGESAPRVPTDLFILKTFYSQYHAQILLSKFHVRVSVDVLKSSKQSFFADIWGTIGEVDSKFLSSI